METDTKKNINQEIGDLINDGRKGSKRPPAERLESLKQAEKLIFESKGESLLDNFLDEMLEFLADDDEEIRSFTMLFIVSAVERDPEIVIKVGDPLYNLLQHHSRQSIYIQKRTIVTCSRIYPQTLAWTNQRRNDRDAEKYWKLFEALKNRILGMVNSTNEGLRIMAIKFTETIIISQSVKSEINAQDAETDVINLSMISRDHRFLSYRKLDNEALQNFNMLLELLSSSTINSQTLLATVSALCNIAKRRPNYMQQVVSAIESLHINLPSTLATNQVKSLRKELRFNLLQMLRHPANFSNHQHLTQLLTDLGCTHGDIQRNMPTPAEVKEALLKRVSLASAAASTSLLGIDRIQPSSSGTSGLTRSADNRDDEPDAKRPRLDDTEFVDEGTAEILRGATAPDEILDASQRAIDITTDFVYERLTTNVVVKLVTISLFTLPDEMPAAFQSSFTDISTAGTDAQKRHLARILAIQLTREGEGPGISFIRAEKQKQYLARQNARMEGSAIPSSSSNEFDQGSSQRESELMPKTSLFTKTKAPKRDHSVKWNLIKMTTEMLPVEAQKLCVMAYHRIIQNEVRAIQGGASLAQHQLLVRLITRFQSKASDLYEEQLIEYILNDQKNRADLALLWLNELYAQYQGYSLFLTEKGEPEKEVRRVRYDKILCSLASLLVNRNDIKETLFHRIFLEVPLITSQSLPWLRKACLDAAFGGFAMSTLREMILTRPRQRNELLEMFSTLSYHEPVASKGRSAAVYDVREQCVEVARELYTIHYIRDDLHNLIISMSNQLTLLRPPKLLIVHGKRLTDLQASELVEEEYTWDEALIRAALNLFLSILPVDHELLHQLASITGKATTDVKRIIFRIIEPAIKTIGMNSPHLLRMIENCPPNAETLVARIVHLLTERNLPSKELVESIRNLHHQRDTDVRSLLPIMVGLKREELLDLIPKFVMNAKNSNSVPLFYRKLLFGQHIETREYLMDSRELLIQLHRCEPKNQRERSHLYENIEQLIKDPDNNYQLSKERVASAIEELLNEEPLAKSLYQTLQKIHDYRPALRPFLSIVLPTAIQKHPDDETLNGLLAKFADKSGDSQNQPIMSY